jgi:hypothetical protein
MIAYVLSFLVGGAFLFSAFVKAVDGRTFLRDLRRYRLLPARALAPSAALGTGAEAVVGGALLFHLWPAGVLPGAMVLLVGLSALTLWGETARDLADCGCYGGVVRLTPRQSVLLNGGYILMLAGALYATPGASWVPSLAGAASVGLGGVGAAVAAWGSRTEPLLDLSRLRPGRRWAVEWLPDHPEVTTEPHFVVFLSPDCPYCKRWVPLLNVMHAKADLPRVLGVLALPDDEREAFRHDHLVRFPLGQMTASRFRHMVSGYPTAVLVEEGAVAEKWEGELPEPYAEQIQAFYDGVQQAASGADEEPAFGG